MFLLLKGASFENNHLPLLKKLLLLEPTTAATLGEIDDAVRTAREAGCEELALC